MIIGLYIYRNTCSFSIANLPIWKEFTNLKLLLCKKIQIDKEFNGYNVIEIVNSFHDIKIIDTKPCILFIDCTLKIIYMYPQRPLNLNNLVIAFNDIKNKTFNNTQIVDPKYINTSDNERRQILANKYESADTIYLFKYQIN